jgi:hypothetical protein
VKDENVTDGIRCLRLIRLADIMMIRVRGKVRSHGSLNSRKGASLNIAEIL